VLSLSCKREIFAKRKRVDRLVLSSIVISAARCLHNGELAPTIGKMAQQTGEKSHLMVSKKP
jgi:hypothetical protein